MYSKGKTKDQAMIEYVNLLDDLKVSQNPKTKIIKSYFENPKWQ